MIPEINNNTIIVIKSSCLLFERILFDDFNQLLTSVSQGVVTSGSVPYNVISKKNIARFVLFNKHTGKFIAPNLNQLQDDKLPRDLLCSDIISTRDSRYYNGDICKSDIYP